MRKLDRVVDHSDDYINRYEVKIDSLKKELRRPGHSLRACCALTDQLAVAYTPYQSDSTLWYFKQNLKYANRLQDQNLIVKAKSSIALCYSLGGRFFEAERMLGSIGDTLHINKDALLAYYTAQHRKNRELYNLSKSDIEPDDDRELLRARDHYYAIQAVRVSTKATTRLYYGYMHAIGEQAWETASLMCDSLLALSPPNSHIYAKAANHKAQLVDRLGFDEEKIKWLVRSAMADVQAAVRDHGSLCAIADELLRHGEVERAMNYIRLAINDTRFFNSPMRSWRDMAILPQIESAYNERNARLHTMYIVLIVIITLFFVTAVIGGLFVLRQNRRLHTIQQILHKSNEKLEQLTHSLRESNEQLNAQNLRITDANRIKEVYIGGFLQTISEYINKMADIYRHANKMLRDDRIDDLKSEFARNTVHNDELKEFYALFDATFLGLFPTFVEELNELLKPEIATETRHGKNLTTELRIYALIRLGISDTATIAALLHCSIRTVYNYRSVTQRHARCDISNFEQQVQMIGLNNLPEK
ncbi:MAG: DUF6377 domain-containing protein [Alistipes sp.]